MKNIFLNTLFLLNILTLKSSEHLIDGHDSALSDEYEQVDASDAQSPNHQAMQESEQKEQQKEDDQALIMQDVKPIEKSEQTLINLEKELKKLVERVLILENEKKQEKQKENADEQRLIAIEKALSVLSENLQKKSNYFAQLKAKLQNCHLTMKSQKCCISISKLFKNCFSKCSDSPKDPEDQV